MMRFPLIVFLFMSRTFGHELGERQANLAGLRGLEMLSPFLGPIPQDNPTLTNNLGLLNFLNNGLVPTNPGLDLLTHGLGFGLAALRGLEIIMQNNHQKREMVKQ